MSHLDTYIANYYNYIIDYNKQDAKVNFISNKVTNSQTFLFFTEQKQISFGCLQPLKVSNEEQ